MKTPETKAVLQPTHIFDVTENEAWQIVRPPHWNEDWKTIRLDPRPNDPDFLTNFKKLPGLVIEWRYNNDPIAIAQVIAAETPEEQAIDQEFEDPSLAIQLPYRIDLLTETFVLCPFKNEGVCSGRLAHDPASLENAFAAEWSKENTPVHGTNLGGGILQDLVCRSLPSPFLSNRERQIAATAIQWLGTNCGRAFLWEVNRRSNNALIRALS